MEKLSSLKRVALLALAVLCMPVGFPQAQGKQATAKDSKSPAAADPSPGAQAPGSADYVGAEVCKTCHEDIYNGWEKSPHWKTTLDTKGGPSHQGCEGCHGPGSAHVAGGGDVTKIFRFKDASIKEINNRCLTCHAGGPEHMNVLNSIHEPNGVSCISCHSPHHAETSQYLLAKPQPQLCYGCHLQQQAQFEMPFHHRVNEGLIQCTDCHNPHGTVRPKQVRSAATLDMICFKCHIDKQGPFVYEHAPVKVEGCPICHNVHGGPNAHMLKVSNVNILCLQCHTTSSFSPAPGAPSFHNQATFFQGCVQCHSSVHGSNFSPFFFQQ